MLQITIPGVDMFNEITNEFYSTKDVTLVLEHSLVSLSKWESKWHKPFLIKDNKNKEEILDYIQCMTITQNVDPNVYKLMTQEIIDEIGSYIENPMTATTFAKNKDGRINREIITAEIIYYWMIVLNIPVEFQKWHLNKLLTLINVCNIKNQPAKKMSKAELAARNRQINAQRKAKLGTGG